VNGPGRLLGLEASNTQTWEIYTDNATTFYITGPPCVAYIQSTTDEGTIRSPLPLPG